MLTDTLLSEIEAGHGQRLAVAAKILPSNRLGRPVTLSCLLRWVISGIRLPNGERVFLEACRIAGKWATTPQAIRRFVEAQTPNIDSAPHHTSTATRTAKRAAVAGKKLEKMGA